MRNTITTAAGLMALGALLAAAPGAAAPDPTGPSSSDGPYLVRTSPGVVTTSVLTVGDAAANGYRLVGKPDGLGAFDNGDGTFTLLVNHEVHFDQGVVRAHGFNGAFVSRWTIDAETLEVLSGADLDQQVLAPAGGRLGADHVRDERAVLGRPAAGGRVPRRGDRRRDDRPPAPRR